MNLVIRRKARRGPVRTAIVLAALAVLSVAGCSPVSTPVDAPSVVDSLIPVSTPSVSAVPVLGTTQGLVLPTDSYRPTAAQQNVIADAVGVKTAQCMSQFGFMWTWTTRASSLPAPHQADRLYGVSDLATAQRYGYHLPSTDNRGRGEQRSLSASERLVLSGGAAGAGASPGDSPASYQGKSIPVGGCAGQARRETIGVDDIDPARVADAITVGMWEKSKTDTRVLAAITAWSDCMKQSGYHYASPLDAGSDHPEWPRSVDPSAAEIGTAVADVRCKQRTNLIGVWFTIESAYENEAIQLRFEQLSHIRKQWEEAAARAAQIAGAAASR